MWAPHTVPLCSLNMDPGKLFTIVQEEPMLSITIRCLRHSLSLEKEKNA